MDINELVEFEFIRTPQDCVYREKVDYFKRCYSRGDKIPPVSAVEQSDDNLLVFNGNHRAMAQYELGRREIEIIILGGMLKLGGIIKRIQEMEILPGYRPEGMKEVQLPKLVW